MRRATPPCHYAYDFHYCYAADAFDVPHYIISFIAPFRHAIAISMLIS
jgi:hypothetical protein